MSLTHTVSWLRLLVKPITRPGVWEMNCIMVAVQASWFTTKSKYSGKPQRRLEAEGTRAYWTTDWFYAFLQYIFSFLKLVLCVSSINFQLSLSTRPIHFLCSSFCFSAVFRLSHVPTRLLQHLNTVSLRLPPSYLVDFDVMATAQQQNKITALPWHWHGNAVKASTRNVYWVSWPIRQLFSWQFFPAKFPVFLQSPG